MVAHDARPNFASSALLIRKTRFVIRASKAAVLGKFPPHLTRWMLALDQMGARGLHHGAIPDSQLKIECSGVTPVAW